MTSKKTPRPIDSIVEFKKWGNTFRRIAYNPITDVFLFKRTSSEGRVVCYEAVKPRIRNKTRCYPSAEDFGVYGKCLLDTPFGREKAARYLNNGW